MNTFTKPYESTEHAIEILSAEVSALAHANAVLLHQILAMQFVMFSSLPPKEQAKLAAINSGSAEAADAREVARGLLRQWLSTVQQVVEGEALSLDAMSVALESQHQPIRMVKAPNGREAEE